MTRTRTVADRAEYERVVDEYLRDGYTALDHTDGRATLRKRDHGSLLTHLAVFFTVGFWTLGLANLLYALYRRWNASDTVCVEVAD